MLHYLEAPQVPRLLAVGCRVPPLHKEQTKAEETAPVEVSKKPRADTEIILMPKSSLDTTDAVVSPTAIF